MRILFLGTGGGRFVTSYQKRKTGGLYIELDGKRIYVDPGPGALVWARQKNVPLEKLDFLIATHNHPDHVTDLAVMIEAMTKQTTKQRGILIGSRSVLEGQEGYRTFSSFHESLLERTILAEPGKSIEFAGLRFSFLPTVHGDPLGIGVRVEGSEKLVLFSDSGYWDGMEEAAEGADVVIFNYHKPGLEKECPYTNDYAILKVLESVKPKLVVLTHFGMRVLLTRAHEKLAEKIREKGLKVICARDFMTLDTRPSGLERFF